MRAQRSGRIINVSSIGGKIYGIAAANLAERSAAGPYAPQAAAMAKVLGVYERRPGLVSGPQAVARVVMEAASARRPKTRYVAGRGARAVLLGRWALSDRGFDRALQLFYRLPR
jgi:NAD(P)-dependent dehydrogenase (short-subunit alcohol dehydrogenase family)